MSLPLTRAKRSVKVTEAPSTGVTEPSVHCGIWFHTQPRQLDTCHLLSIDFRVTLLLRMHVTRYTHEPQLVKTNKEAREYCYNKVHNLDIEMWSSYSRHYTGSQKKIKKNMYLRSNLIIATVQ